MAAPGLFAQAMAVGQAARATERAFASEQRRLDILEERQAPQIEIDELRAQQMATDIAQSREKRGLIASATNEQGVFVHEQAAKNLEREGYIADAQAMRLTGLQVQKETLVNQQSQLERTLAVGQMAIDQAEEGNMEGALQFMQQVDPSVEGIRFENGNLITTHANGQETSRSAKGWRESMIGQTELSKQQLERDMTQLEARVDLQVAKMGLAGDIAKARAAGAKPVSAPSPTKLELGYAETMFKGNEAYDALPGDEREKAKTFIMGRAKVLSKELGGAPGDYVGTLMEQFEQNIQVDEDGGWFWFDSSKFEVPPPGTLGGGRQGGVTGTSDVRVMQTPEGTKRYTKIGDDWYEMPSGE